MTSIKQSYQGSTLKLALLGFGLFVAGTNAFVIAGLLPDIADTLGATPTDVSYSITSYSLVVAVASPVVSIVLARVPRSLLMSAGLIVFAIGGALAASSDSIGLFIAGRTLSGLGAAALVPTATASAASLAPPEKRGRALAIVGAGFTLATAVGSPFGTLLGGSAGWRVPLWALVGIAVVLAVAVPLVVRGLPIGHPVSFRRRLAPLADRRILAPLGTTLLMVAGFNVVYIFSSAVTEPSTGGSGALLAVLLLSYGIAGVFGNLAAGPATDRLGSRRAAIIGLSGQIASLIVLTFVEWSFAATIVVFAVWGFAAFAIAVPVQHRLVGVDPESAGVTLSWYSTAMYIGIAIAPPLGNAALALGGPAALPIAGAASTLLGLILFLISYRIRNGSRELPASGS
ncbi:MFS transporter [Amnibacterium flavum]|uniref:MFS transporter n=1 Tax=Amnibacterium flavum TaxID=2173173 RepID=A0A2V1HLH5_9MICO|nr:MFS transporter [Amnibacterium flavum]PVZ93408.1 MFS transporter [Amnibacterium flavum]